MSQPLYLVLDQGGQSSRALVFDGAGQLLKQARYKINTHTPQPQHVEHDAAEMLHSLRTVASEVLQQLGDDKQRIVAAGLACQRSSIACWQRETGEALSPIISWQDTRAADWLKQFETDATDIHQRSGLFLSAHYGASKLRWCLDHLPAVQNAQQQNTLALGPLASFLAFNLCAEKPLRADPANAARTLLWNLQSQNWDNTLLTLFGIAPSLLPPCTDSRSDWGHLDIDGLRIPLTIVTGDQSAALFCHGMPDNNSAYINLGTGAFIQVASKTAVIPARQLCSLVHSEAGFRQYVIEGTVNGGASALNWLAKQHAQRSEQFELNDWLDDSKSPPLFINSISGLGSPWWRSDIEPRFIGDNSSIPAQAVAVIESIVFMLCVNLETMRQHTAPIQQIIASGGLSQVDGLCQRLADISGISVLRTEQSEATGLGLAYLLAQRPPQNLTPSSQIFLPQTNLALQKRYQQWQQLMPQI